jgi:hypothetical protein
VTASAIEPIFVFSLVEGSTVMVSGGRKNLRKQTLLGRLHDVRISYAYSCSDRPVDSGGIFLAVLILVIFYFVVTRFLKV